MVCKRLEVSDAVQVINHNDAHLIKKSLIVEYLPPCPERDSMFIVPKDDTGVRQCFISAPDRGCHSRLPLQPQAHGLQGHWTACQ
jgi:hypothetical protein